MGQANESEKDATTVAAADAPPSATIEQPAETQSKPEPMRSVLRDSLSAIAAPLAARPRLSRVTVLTIAIALSGAAGSAVGAMAAAAFAKPEPRSSDNVRTIEVNNLRGVITQLSSEIVSLKSALDNNTKTANAQFAKIAERVERAEKAQGEPSARIAKMSDALDRLERKTAAAQTVAPALAAAPDTTGSIAPKQQDRPPVVAGWVVRDYFRGRAMVENTRLGLFEVVPGANLPGIGRVETIRREDGRWVVVTPKGLIVSER